MDFGNFFQRVKNFATFGGWRDDAERRKADEEERRRKAAEAAQQRAAQQKQQVTVQQSQGMTLQPQNQGVLQNNQNNNRPTKNSLLGLTLNSNDPFAINQKPVQPNQPKVADLNPQIKEAKQKLEQKYQKPVKDVDNYYGEDLKKLQDELAKGNSADTNRVKGLMQSLDNRRTELEGFNKSSYGQKEDGFNLFNPGTWGKRENLEDYKKDNKQQAERKEENETNQWLTKNGEVQLNSGTTINKYVEQFNKADAGKQAEMKKKLAEQASRTLDYGDEDTIKERNEATILLTALKQKGDEKFDIFQKAGEFGGNIIKSTVDTATNVGDAGRVLATNKTSQDDIEADYKAGKIDKKEYIKRINESQNRLSEFTGGTEDRGLLDRALRSAGVTADIVSTVVPIGTAYKGGKLTLAGLKAGGKRELAKFMGKETALNASLSGAGALRQGTDTTAEDIAAEAAGGGIIGGIASGGGVMTGAALRGGRNRLTRNNLLRRDALEEGSPLGVLQRAKREAEVGAESVTGRTLTDEGQPINAPKAAPTMEDINRQIDEINKNVAEINKNMPLEPVPELNLPTTYNKGGSPDAAPAPTPQRAKPITNEDVTNLQSSILNDQQNLLTTDPTLTRREDGAIVNTAGEVVSESPTKIMQTELQKQADEQMVARGAADEAATRQAAPEANPEPSTAPNDAPAAPVQRGSIDTSEAMQRIQARREAFNENADEAIAAANSQTVNREASYDPTTPADKSEITKQLQELGVDPRGFEGVTISRLNSVLKNTDWSKVQNPGGYIRETVRRMAAADTANPTLAAMTPRVRREPLLNERGEVMLDDAGKPIYKETQSVNPEETPISTPENTNFEAGQRTRELAASDLTGAEREAAIKNLVEQVYGETDTALRQAGSSFDDMTRQVAEANRGLRPDIDEAIKPIYQNFRKELDEAYQYRKSLIPDDPSRKVTEFGDQGDFYLPQQRAGQQAAEQASSTDFISGLEDGFTLERTNSIDVNELDTSVTPYQRYFNEMLNVQEPQQKMASTMVREAQAEGRIVDASQVNVAAQQMVELQQSIKQAATMTKNERAGNTVKNLFRPDKIETNLYKIPVAQKLSEIGDMLGKKRITVTANVRGFTLLNKVDNMQIGNSTFGEQGVHAYYDAEALANSAFDAATQQGDVVTSVLEPMIDKLQYIPDRDKQAVLRDLNNRLTDIGEDLTEKEVRDATVFEAKRTLRNAAKMNLTELAQAVEFKDKNARKMFDEAANGILVNDKINQGYVDAIFNAASTWTNNALRGYNPKSAATELGDFGEINTVAGNINVMAAQAEFLRNPSLMVDTMRRYGRMGGLDPKAEWAASNGNTLQRVIEAVSTKKPIAVLKTIGDPMALVKGVTLYKESVALNALERQWSKQGLTGTALTQRVLRDYYETVLPSSPLNRSALNDTAVKRFMFQYMNWQVMNVRRSFRFATGQADIGRLANMGQGKAAATYITNAGATKASLWAAQNTLFGTTIASAFGIFDPAGVFSGDFSKIEEDQKTILDRAMGMAGVSPVSSMLEQAYFSVRREQERAEAVRNDEYTQGDKTNPNFSTENAMNDFLKQGKNFLFPGALQANKTKEFLDNSERGYATNNEGRITYQTPETGSLDWFRGLVGGGGATSAGREYSDAPDLLKDSPIEAISKDQMIDNFLGTRDYNRPLSATTYDEGYSDEAKQAFAAASEQYGANSETARKVLADWIADGREYNRLYDKFGKENPEQFKRWTDTYGEDVLTPEKWRVYQGNPEIFDFLKKRRLMEERDLGRTVDPIYKLPDEQAKAILQERSMYTGDDMKQREFLYRYDWYGKFKDAESNYYQQFNTADNNDRKQSERVVQWNALSKQAFDPKSGVINKYPAVKQQQEILNKYGFDSAESKAWFAANGDAYKQQKLQYEQDRFNLINEMRKLEGVEPLTVDQYMAKIDFPEQDENGNWTGGKFGSGYSRGGGRRGNGEYNDDYNKINDTSSSAQVSQAPEAKKMTKVALKINTSAGSRKPRARITLRDMQRSRVKEETI